jgi:YVTN family beta-propeller protein
MARIDPGQNAVVARIKVETVNACPPFPRVCSEAVAGNGAVWVTHPSDNTISRIDPRTNSVSATIQVGLHPTGIAVSRGAVWVANLGGPSVSRIDPTTNRVVAEIPVGPSRACCATHMAVTAGGDAVWASVTKLNTVVRVDPATNGVVARIRVLGPCGFLAADTRAVWASGGVCIKIVTRVDPSTNKQTGTVKGMQSPIGLGLGFGSLWVADLHLQAIDRVDPRTARTVARLPVGGLPETLGVGFGSVWVRDVTGRVIRIRPTR